MGLLHRRRNTAYCVAAFLIIILNRRLFSSKMVEVDPPKKWGAELIIKHMRNHPSRAYFADLFRLGGFRSGIEVGVADGRFSEHVLKLSGSVPILWHMVEPFPNENLKRRFEISANGTANFGYGRWAEKHIGHHAHKLFSMQLSTDTTLLSSISDEGVDFIYLDGAHDYVNVRLELPLYYAKVKPGGVLAGHDYCNFGESALRCIGCSDIPACQKYTAFGMSQGKPNKISKNQAGVVMAVQRWLVEDQPQLRLHHTVEDFNRQTLLSDGMDFDLVITNTLNPSWYVVKPLE